MNNHTAFMPYFYTFHEKSTQSKTDLYQGLDLLLKIIGSISHGCQGAVTNLSALSDLRFNLMLRPSPPIYQAQFPNLMNNYRPLALTSLNRKISKEHPVAITAGYYNIKKSSRRKKKKTILNEIKTNAYKRRNVYKSVIRHMFSCIKKNKSKIISLLSSKGFTDSEINTAFNYISSLNILDKQKGKTKRPQNTIKTILETKNIHVYILKESLEAMLSALKSGLTGKIMRKNTKIYKEVCEEYYNKCLELLV